MIQAGFCEVKSMSFSAIKIRKDGSKKNLGTIAFWHKNPLIRALWEIKQTFKTQGILAAALAVLVFSGKFPAIFFALATVFANTGRAIVTNRLKSLGTEPNFVAWGTGAGVSAVTDTTLFSESTETRTVGVSTRVTTFVSNDTYQVVGILTATAPRTITNAGLFDAITNGNLFIKGDFSSIGLNVGEGIQFTIQLVFT